MQKDLRLALEQGRAVGVPLPATGGSSVALSDFNSSVDSVMPPDIPPVELELPGVMAVPSALKKIRRGPSEVKTSDSLLELKGSG